MIDAIKRGDSFSANFLLEKKCNVNLITKSTSDTALHLVCTYSEKSTDQQTFEEMLAVSKKLLAVGTDPNMQNIKG